jgi:hypothetical protein
MAPIGKKMLIAEITRLEGLLGKSRKSSEGLVDDIGLDKDMGEGATVACDAGYEDMEFEEEIDPISDELLSEDDDFGGMAAFMASETAPGIEDEITQDFLDEVEEEVGADNISTEDTTKDVVASEGYAARLAEASARLDRVASFVEKQGQVKLAYRLDRLADILDAERSKLSV